MWLSTHWCLCIGILHNRQAKNHLLCPKKKKQSTKNWKKNERLKRATCLKWQTVNSNGPNHNGTPSLSGL